MYRLTAFCLDTAGVDGRTFDKFGHKDVFCCVNVNPQFTTLSPAVWHFVRNKPTSCLVDPEVIFPLILQSAVCT